MKKLTFLLTSLLLLGFVGLQAKQYTPKDIPMVRLQDRTRYVSNPDNILSPRAVTVIDSILYALEQKTGIQTVVAVVTGIEGGDCFDFAYRLGQEKGVGQKNRDNGLVILLSTDERCVQFATGYGLEGTLPDAICKRIQNRYMLPHFRNDDWNTGMVEGIRAINGYLDGSMENIDDQEEDEIWILLLIMAFILGGICLGGIAVYLSVRQKTRCPQCKQHTLQRVSSRIVGRNRGVKTEDVTYRCRNCGHMLTRREQSQDENYQPPRNGGGTIIMGGGSGWSGREGFGGGSFGGGSFGGGGAGSRF